MDSDEEQLDRMRQYKCFGRQQTVVFTKPQKDSLRFWDALRMLHMINKRFEVLLANVKFASIPRCRRLAFTITI